MSGSQASGSKQHEETAADAVLLALHLTHREATLLFSMTARHHYVADTEEKKVRTRLAALDCTCLFTRNVSRED
jgi:hypothetical protein